MFLAAFPELYLVVAAIIDLVQPMLANGGINDRGSSIAAVEGAEIVAMP